MTDLGTARKIARQLIAGQTAGRMSVARDLEDVIERRGLQDAYIRALLPDYHSFEPMTPAELFTFLRVTPEQRARAFLAAAKGIE